MAKYKEGDILILSVENFDKPDIVKVQKIDETHYHFKILLDASEGSTYLGQTRTIRRRAVDVPRASYSLITDARLATEMERILYG